MKSILATFTFVLLTSIAAFAEDSAFVGTWETNWGKLVISPAKEEGKLSGTYSGEFTGTIEGHVKKEKFHFTWKQPNGEWGSGVFKISEEGELMGTWGSAESETNGGPWTGTKK